MIEIVAGDVVISPAGEVHGFENKGNLFLRKQDSHVTDRIEQERLEDERGVLVAAGAEGGQEVTINTAGSGQAVDDRFEIANVPAMVLEASG